MGFKDAFEVVNERLGCALTEARRVSISLTGMSHEFVAPLRLHRKEIPGVEGVLGNPDSNRFSTPLVCSVLWNAISWACAAAPPGRVDGRGLDM